MICYGTGFVWVLNGFCCIVEAFVLVWRPGTSQVKVKVCVELTVARQIFAFLDRWIDGLPNAEIALPDGQMLGPIVFVSRALGAPIPTLSFQHQREMG